MIHCGFVGILGLPNAGKSTFLNHVTKEKISIVSSKPQATRRSFTGLVTTDSYQLIFFDAPGFVPPKQGLFQYLASEFGRVIEKSDVLLMLIANDQEESKAFEEGLETVRQSKKPVVYMFSKADLAESQYVAELKKKLLEDSATFFEFSTKNGDAKVLEENLQKLAESLPKEHHPLYDPDMISLDKTRDIVAEFIREECFEGLDKEIPFGLGVIIKSFKVEKGMQHIHANIIVDKENHKSIVIGKQGQMLKKIGQGARKKIEKLLGEKIFLGLHVAHKKNWSKSQGIMKELGYYDDRK